MLEGRVQHVRGWGAACQRVGRSMSHALVNRDNSHTVIPIKEQHINRHSAYVSTHRAHVRLARYLESLTCPLPPPGRRQAASSDPIPCAKLDSIVLKCFGLASWQQPGPSG